MVVGLFYLYAKHISFDTHAHLRCVPRMTKPSLPDSKCVSVFVRFSPSPQSTLPTLTLRPSQRWIAHQVRNTLTRQKRYTIRTKEVYYPDKRDPLLTLERPPDHRHGPTSSTSDANGGAISRARKDNTGGGDMRFLTKANGCLGFKEFEAAMNQQVQEYIRRNFSKNYQVLQIHYPNSHKNT